MKNYFSSQGIHSYPWYIDNDSALLMWSRPVISKTNHTADLLPCNHRITNYTKTRSGSSPSGVIPEYHKTLKAYQYSLKGYKHTLSAGIHK